MIAADPTKILLSHPTGNEFFRHLALALNGAGRLARLCTCIDWTHGGIADRLLPRAIGSELGRRSMPPELKGLVLRHPLREGARLAAGRVGLKRLTRHEAGPLSVDAVYRDFDRWVAGMLRDERDADTSYAYEDAAEATFAEAARLGWRRVYDLPIAYWETGQRLMAEEAARLPAWEPTLGGTRDSNAKLARKTRELELADVVICPSRFVENSLPDWARTGKKVVVVPFGSPSVAETSERRPSGRRKMRVMFAGGMTQRKGLGDLFAAMRILERPDVELVVMGSPIVPMDFYRREYADFVYEPPRAHAEVLALMQTCDVFCLPSVVEGRALVIQEAMSRGLPPIITPNTGADDAVEDRVNGFVVPIRSPEAIAGKIAWFADHRDRLEAMGRAAQTAAGRFTWEQYGAIILAALDRLQRSTVHQDHL